MSPATMRAAVVERYGPPEAVHIVEVPRPEAARGEVLVRVGAAAVTSGDARIRAGRFPPGTHALARLAFGLTGPRRHILGGTVAGVVDSVGPDVVTLVPGAAVCGMTGTRLGTHAEYVVVPSRRLAPIPPGVSIDDAAGVLFGGTAALFFLRDKAMVTPGRSVLVNGASGAVGTNAVQLAKHFGATVTAVTSAANVELVTGLGADEVVDYTKRDVLTSGQTFDVVLDAVGNFTIAVGRRLLDPDGVLLLAVPSLWDTVRAHGRVRTGSAPERAEDFELLLALVASGDLVVVHDHIYEFDAIVDAHRRVDSQHKRGNVVVRMQGARSPGWRAP